MKKLLMFSILFFFTMNVFAENKMIIKFIPSKIYDVELDFLDENGYTNYQSFIESLEKGKRVFLECFIPKTGIIEGEYQIQIFEDNVCVSRYTVINDDFVYNEIKGVCQKVPNVLNNLRAILYLESINQYKEK